MVYKSAMSEEKKQVKNLINQIFLSYIFLQFSKEYNE